MRNLYNFPDFCFTVLDDTDEVVLVKRFEDGYYPYYNGAVKGQSKADKLNEQLGIKKNFAEAMKVGSMFGWNVPACNPTYYNEDGKMI